MARQTRAVTEPQREGSTSSQTGGDEVGFNLSKTPYSLVPAARYSNRRRHLDYGFPLGGEAPRSSCGVVMRGFPIRRSHLFYGDEGYFDPSKTPQLFIFQSGISDGFQPPHPSPDVRTGDTFPTEGEGLEIVFPLAVLP